MNKAEAIRTTKLITKQDVEKLQKIADELFANLKKRNNK